MFCFYRHSNNQPCDLSKMADEIGTAKDALDVLSEVVELGSTLFEVSKIVSLVGALGPAFPLVGAILSLIQGFLPDAKHEEIIGRFNELSNKMDRVRDDIHFLEKEIRWAITEQTYVDKVHHIEEGMELWLKLGKAENNETRTLYQARLKQLCSGEMFSVNLNFILKGMCGISLTGAIQRSLFDELYDKTGGDRPRISALGVRLLQLVFGGVMVITTCETMEYGEMAAKHEARPRSLRLKAAALKLKLVQDKCQFYFDRNMLNDLNKKLDEGGSNEQLATEISRLMSVKYDWLENFVLVYNDMWGFDKHTISGYRVESLHRNNKCGFVFYRWKSEKPTFRDNYNVARYIVFMADQDVFKKPHASKSFDLIKNALEENGIKWRGLAVICYPSNAEMQYKSTFSIDAIYVDKIYWKIPEQSRAFRYVGSKVILLLE